MTGWTRREALRLAGTAALVAACEPAASGPSDAGADPGVCPASPLEGTPGADPGLVPLAATTFPLGLMAGSMDATRAVATCVIEGAIAAKLVVWRGEGEATRIVHEASVDAREGYLKAAIEGLSPGTEYRYAFVTADGAGRSETGRFRTPFEAGCRAPVRFAATTCTKTHPYRSLSLAAQHDVDAFVHLGDMSYNDGAETLDEFRAKWKASIADDGYRAILAKAGLYITWDDHEYRNNTGWQTGSAASREAFKRAFFELLPVEEGPGGRLWRSHRFGDSVELFVLDSRSERKPDTRSGPDAEYLSKAQMDWLVVGLKASRAHFKVLMSSVPLANFPDPWLAQDDRWEGYAAQRSRLLAEIEANGIRNVWSLSGDFHVGAVLRLEREGFGAKMWDILVGPGANGPNPLEVMYRSSPRDAESIAPADQFKYLGGRHAATLLDFDPVADEVRVRFLDAENGAALFDERLKQG